MYVGFILSIFASLTVIGMMILRKKSPSLLRPYKTWGYPLTPILFVGINIWIVIFSIRNNLTAFIWGLVTIFVGLVAYECFERNTRKSNSDLLPKN
jgi:APA family basic amino acid/polyamine antiporter